MACKKILYVGNDYEPRDDCEFYLKAKEEGTLGIYGAGVDDVIQLQHNVAGEWVDTIVYSQSQQLSVRNTLIGVRGARKYRVIRVNGDSNIKVELDW